VAGAVTLLFLAADIAATADPSARRRLGRWLAWSGLAATLAFLFWLHPQLDRLLNVEESRILDRKTFRTGHKVYLWTSTVQWVFGLVYLGLTPGAWRDADRAAPTDRVL
jgi:hypothetical protein